MTEKKYIQLLVADNWKIWLAILVASLVIGYFIAQQLKPKFESVVSFATTRAQVQETDNTYTYDGYYAEQANVTARNNLHGWLKAPGVVQAIFDQASVPTGAKSPADLSRAFKLNDNINTNVVDVAISTGAKDDTRKLTDAVSDYVRNNFKAANTAVITNASTIQEVPAPKNLIWAATAFGLTLLGFFVTLVLHYFKSE